MSQGGPNSSGGGGSADAVTAPSPIPDDEIVRGDGGVREVQGSGITIDDSRNIDNGASLNLDPGATGDPHVQFDINGTGEFRIGVDDTAADAFKISQGSALGTNDTFIMTSVGERTMPLQPAFLAFLETTDSNQTGNGATYTLGSGNALTEVFDQGGDFNTNGTFTSPVTGRYNLAFNIRFDGMIAADLSQLSVETSNRSFRCTTLGGITPSASGGFMILDGAVFADMDAADTATFTLFMSGEASNIIDIFGTTFPNTFVYGNLTC